MFIWFFKNNSILELYIKLLTFPIINIYGYHINIVYIYPEYLSIKLEGMSVLLVFQF